MGDRRGDPTGAALEAAHRLAAGDLGARLDRKRGHRLGQRRDPAARIPHALHHQEIGNKPGHRRRPRRVEADEARAVREQPTQLERADLRAHQPIERPVARERPHVARRRPSPQREGQKIARPEHVAARVIVGGEPVGARAQGEQPIPVRPSVRAEAVERTGHARGIGVEREGATARERDVQARLHALEGHHVVERLARSLEETAQRARIGQQGGARIHDRAARAHRACLAPDGVVGLEHGDRVPAAGERRRRGETREPSSDDHRARDRHQPASSSAIRRLRKSKISRSCRRIESRSSRAPTGPRGGA